MEECVVTETTLAGVITYRYLVLRPSKPIFQLFSVFITLPNGDKQDVTGGFFKGNDPILSEELKTKMITEAA